MSPLSSARDEENRSSLPTRSVSWDVGMVVQSLGLKDRLDPERFEALNTRLQEMLTDDEERIYTGSYGPKSLRRLNERRVMKVRASVTEPRRVVDTGSLWKSATGLFSIVNTILIADFPPEPSNYLSSHANLLQNLAPLGSPTEDLQEKTG